MGKESSKVDFDYDKKIKVLSVTPNKVRWCSPMGTAGREHILPGETRH